MGTKTKKGVLMVRTTEKGCIKKYNKNKGQMRYAHRPDRNG